MSRCYSSLRETLGVGSGGGGGGDASIPEAEWSEQG